MYYHKTLYFSKSKGFYDNIFIKFYKLVTKMKTKNENIVSICRSITIFLLILAILITILYDSKIGILFALSGFISSAIPEVLLQSKKYS